MESLTHEELTDVIDLALWAGQLLLQHGAEAIRIEETVHHLGTELGADWMDILVSPNALIATTTSGGEFRTKVRRVTRMGVNFDIVDQVNDLSYQVQRGEIDRFQMRTALERISQQPPLYHRWHVIGMVGLACAAFSQLFGATWPVSVVTFGAAAAAMWVRQELTRRYFNGYLVVGTTAFVAGLIASSAPVLDIGENARVALAAAVLLVVPGVPLINAAEDLIEGSVLSGVARGVIGALVSLCIAVGLSLAMWLMGVELL